MDRAIQSHFGQNGLAAVLGTWSAGGGPLYRRLAAAVRTAVQRGDLTAGTRLPPERVLAQQLRVSRSTVVAAYETLQDEQLIERRQGSGTRIRPRQARGGIDHEPGIDLARTLGRNSLFRGLIDRPTTTLDLIGAYLLARGGIPTEALEGIDDEIVAASSTSGYSPLGYPPLRQAIADHLSKRGLATTPEQVLVTAGAQQAVHLAAWLHIDRGDAVIVENPTYPGALDAFTSVGARLLGVATGRGGVDVDSLGELAERFSPRLVYLIPTYQNPVGSVLVATRRRVLADLVEDHGFVLLEDDSLAGLGFGPSEPPPVAAYARKPGSTPILTVGSLSKVCWGGLRIGWLRGPEAAIGQIGRLKAVADLGGSLPSQIIATRLFKHLDAIRRERVHLITERLAIVSDLLQMWLPTWTWDPPQGGLCLWVRLPRGNAAEFAQVALRHGVSIVSGSVTSVDASFADHLRLPFGHDPATLEEAIRRLARAWDAYFPVHQRRAESVSVLV